jgi:RNA polymerase sigma-70 factor (ECF subfamily)
MAGRQRTGLGREEEQQLVGAILAGDDTSFAELYASFQPRVFAFALQRVGNPSDAEDISQEVFLQIHLSLPSFQGRASLSTWIFGIAHNLTCRHFRSASASVIRLREPAVAHDLVVMPHAERRLDAVRAVHDCDRILSRARPPDHREIFHRFYGGGQSLRTIADATGKPTDCVKHSLQRTRDLLLRELPSIRSALGAASA